VPAEALKHDAEAGEIAGIVGNPEAEKTLTGSEFKEAAKDAKTKRNLREKIGEFAKKNIETTEVKNENKMLAEQLKRVKSWMGKAEMAMALSAGVMVSGIAAAAVGGVGAIVAGSQGAVAGGLNAVKNGGLGILVAGVLIDVGAFAFDAYMGRREKEIVEKLEK
jgi:cell shape-determining protein MreC